MLTHYIDGEVPYEVSVRAFIFTCYGDSGISSPFFSRVGSKSSCTSPLMTYIFCFVSVIFFLCHIDKIMHAEMLCIYHSSSKSVRRDGEALE